MLTPVFMNKERKIEMGYLIVIGLLFMIIISMVYTRHMPVVGVQSQESLKSEDPATVVVDVRDYQTAHKDMIQDAVNIPVGYLKRNYNQIEKQQVHIIAETKLDKNMSIRFLRKKGFTVKNYSLVSQSNH